jgi:hypothetical protein
VPEGLSAGEVGKEIADHKKHTAGERDHSRHDRWLSILEALLLSLVAVLAAYSGYAAAKWSTESSITLAKASAEHNPDAPPGPAYMPQYVIPQDAIAKASDGEADAAFAEGAEAGATADKYIRATVFLATVLFLVGISGHFPIRVARVGLICAGGSILIFAAIQLLGLPGPPA